MFSIIWKSVSVHRHTHTNRPRHFSRKFAAGMRFCLRTWLHRIRSWKPLRRFASCVATLRRVIMWRISSQAIRFAKRVNMFTWNWIIIWMHWKENHQYLIWFFFQGGNPASCTSVCLVWRNRAVCKEGITWWRGAASSRRRRWACCRWGSSKLTRCFVKSLPSFWEQNTCSNTVRNNG